jgi:integrase
MAQGQLTAIAVQNITKVGKWHDGGGLYLQVSNSGSKSWVYRYQIDGVPRSMGLGSLRKVSLKQARVRVRQLGTQREIDGIDPLEAKRAAKAARKAAGILAASTLTFAQCAELYIKAARANWRDPKSADVWHQSLRDYVYPYFQVNKPGDLPVNLVNDELVIKALEALWQDKTDTAGKVRGRIEAILDWARVHKHRPNELNPARWRGHLEHVFLKRHKVEHLKAMPYDEAPDFVAKLRAFTSDDANEQDRIAGLALQYLILTCARRDEVREAVWGEIDLEGRTWTVPPERMKRAREWRVPLSDAAMTILEAIRPAKVSSDTPVFPGPALGGFLSERRMIELLQRKLIPGSELTLHGFRSTAMDWAADKTTAAKEVRDLMLAHAVGDKTEESYRRSDMFGRRRELSDAWAGYLDNKTATVTTLPQRQAAS